MKTLSLIALILVVVFSFNYAYGQETPVEWVFETQHGGLLYSENNPSVVIFHTDKAMTKGPELKKDWRTTQDFEKDLTALGVDLHARLVALDMGVAGTAVTFRAISIQKYPRDKWADLLPLIKKALE